MRRSRRGTGTEFGSSGEDSFVAVVVTKLTGALLFILLLTMVIMALLPKAVDLEGHDQKTDADSTERPGRLEIATPPQLPEAIAGRPYLLALAATGGRGPLTWSVVGGLPAWLQLDQATGRLGGTPARETTEPLTLGLQVSDGAETAAQPAELSVLPYQAPTSLAAVAKSHLAAVRWRMWLEQGVGFLVLWLVHLLGMNLLTSIERTAVAREDLAGGGEADRVAVAKRFAAYRLWIRLATLSAVAGLVVWLVVNHGAHPISQ
jgi:hypothetical protein